MVKVLSFRFQQCFGPFTMLLVEGSSERDFLDIYLTTFFGVRKFKNTSAMRVIFLFKMLKIESRSRKCENKMQKKSFLSEIIASEDVAINCLH